ARAGLTLYALNRPRRRRAEPERFTDFSVVTSAAEVAGQPFEVAILAVPSTALTDAAWLGALARALPAATVVMLQPGPDDRRLLAAHVPGERIVQGMITLVSYFAPLPGEALPEPGVAYWLPPLSAS